MTRQPTLRILPVVLFCLAALVILLCAPFFGAGKIGLREIFVPDSTNFKIFWEIRLPRVLLGFLVGAALAISGMSFQAIFRNPLATPFVLGVSAGASLGVAVYVNLGIDQPLSDAITRMGESIFSATGGEPSNLVRWLLPSGKTLAAFLGAVFAIIAVYCLTRLRRGFSTFTLLLAGVSVSFFFSSMILFVQYASEATHALMILRWLMGDLVLADYVNVVYVLPLLLLGALFAFYLRRDLNLILSGDDVAMSRGVNVNRMKLLVFFIMSIVTGGVVAVCGPIGFVGMMVPHMCRLLVGAEHSRLIPVTVLFGGAFLVVCDAFARTIAPPAEVPVAVVTALLGGPFFIYLLVRRQGEGTVF
jgi:iron complex transport system permease protein